MSSKDNQSKIDSRRRIGKTHRQLEDTLKFFFYYHLNTDPIFKRDFLLWAGFNELADDDNVMAYIEWQNENSKIIHDIQFVSQNIKKIKTVELKVWTRLTDLQKEYINTIDLIIAPEFMIQSEWKSKSKTWFELRDYFKDKQDYFKNIEEHFTTGDNPRESEVLNEIKEWANNNIFPIRTACFLDKICYYADNIELKVKGKSSELRCRDNWYKNKQERYFTFCYKNGDKELYAGFFWDKDYCKLGFKIDVTESLKGKPVDNIPHWYEFHEGHTKLYTTILCEEVTDINIDAKKLAEKIQLVAGELNIP